MLFLAASAAKCKKKTRDLGIRKEIDKLGLMKCAECPTGATGRLKTGLNFCLRTELKPVHE